MRELGIEVVSCLKRMVILLFNEFFEKLKRK